MTERRFVIRIEGLPTAADGRELLELVLAAASLDLDVVVLLCGSAAGLLTGAEHAGWRQLVEQDLARVCVGAGSGDLDVALPDAVETLSSTEVSHLERSSIVIQA